MRQKYMIERLDGRKRAFENQTRACRNARSKNTGVSGSSLSIEEQCVGAF